MGDRFRHLMLWLICPGILFSGLFNATGVDVPDPVVLHLSGGTLPPGGVIALGLVLSGTAPDTLVLHLAFDTALLQVCDILPGAAGQGKVFAYRPSATGLTLVIYGGAAPLTEGTVATVVLEASPGAPVGEVLPGDNGSSAADSEANARSIRLTADPVVVAAWSNPHSADTDQNGRIGFSELLRLIQLYNAGGLSCEADSEDGFAPGEGDRNCAPHDLDYAGQDWRIGFSELLRGIQFYNAYKGTYHPDATSEDGFAPGL